MSPDVESNAGASPSSISQRPTTRHVLGDVSPNIKKTPTPSMFDAKPLAGSPLKRAFTSSMTDSSGFKYLKRRRLSDEDPLSQIVPDPEQPLAVESMFVTQNGLQLSHSHPDPTCVPMRQQITATEPNSPAEHEEPSSCDERKSFSSLINYDPSSQNATGSQSRSGLVSSVSSNAELLKLRLRVAMYKVRTNQVDVSFEDLEAPIPSDQPIAPTEIEAAVAQLRREAQARIGQQPAGRLLPAPLLLPTSYSSRVVYPTDWTELTVPSSPPPGYTDVRRWEALTPHNRRFADAQSEKELTSSIIKGRVAEGLLGLRHAV